MLDKVSEEISEIRQAQSDEEREREVGDLLFSVVNACRWMDIDAEAALRHANSRFYGRFTGMEELSKTRELNFRELSLDEKEGLWQEVKEAEREGAG